MAELDDAQLLEEYARSKSETAFSAIVERHLNVVYSAAMRYTDNSHHAQEITQAVFVILARKAGNLKRGTVLSGWLYQTARMTSANFIKSEKRRIRREQEAYMQSTTMDTDSTAWVKIAPLLDEAMGSLGETDRNVIVLSYFERKTANDVARALRMNESAAHKRISRAVDKLRKFFAHRGVTLSAAAIAGLVSTNSVHAAPIGLASTVSNVVIGGAATAATTSALVKSTLNLMAWAKLKFAMGVTAALMLATTATPVVWHYEQAHFGEQSRTGNEAWRTRFERVYALKPGEVLKHIPQPYILERTSFYYLDEASRAPAQLTGGLPNSFVFVQNEKGLQLNRSVSATPPLRLSDVLLDIFGVTRHELDGPAGLLQTPLNGDWVLRSGTSRDELIKAFSDILVRETGRHILIEPRTEEREVIVVRGSYSAGFKRQNDGNGVPRLDVFAETKDHPVTAGAEQQSVSRTFASTIYGRGAHGAAQASEFFKLAGNWMNLRFVNEIADEDQKQHFDWQLHQDAYEGTAKAGRILENLADQTGLSFSREKRPVEVWFVNEAK